MVPAVIWTSRSEFSGSDCSLVFAQQIFRLRLQFDLRAAIFPAQTAVWSSRSVFSDSDCSLVFTQCIFRFGLQFGLRAAIFLVQAASYWSRHKQQQPDANITARQPSFPQPPLSPTCPAGHAVHLPARSKTRLVRLCTRHPTCRQQASS